ncbi:hypothetical protein GGF32_001163 [Allomyces javanicus]|nr:hypothetical protein GGF32_001163 [Allomyces javanicus]
MDCRVCQGFSHAVVCGPCVATTRARHQARHFHLTTELHDARARATAAVLDPTRTTTAAAAAARSAAQARRAALTKRQADLAAAQAKVPARVKHAIDRAKRHLRAVEAPAANAHHVLVQELVRVFRLRCDDGREPTILGVPLAASGDVMAVISHTDADNKAHDAERLNAALAHTAQLVNLMAMYLNVHLPFDLDAVPSRAVARVHYHPPPSTSTSSGGKKPAISPTSTVSASMLGFSNFLHASAVVDALGTSSTTTTTDAAPIYFSPASGAEEFAVGLAMLNYQVLHLCAAVGVHVRQKQMAHTLANLNAAIDAVRRNRAGSLPGGPAKRVKVVPFRTVLNVVTKRIQKHEAELGFRFVRRVSGGSGARGGGGAATRAATAAAADVDTGDEGTRSRRVSGAAAVGLPGPVVGKAGVRPSDLDTVFTVVFPLDMDSDGVSSDEDDDEEGDDDDDETDDPASDDDDNDCATEIGTREPVVAAGDISPASASLPRARSSIAADTPVVPPDRRAAAAAGGMRASPPTPTAPPLDDDDDDWELDLDTHVPTDMNAGQDTVTPARFAAAARAVWEEGRRSLSRSPAPHATSSSMSRRPRGARDPFDLLDSAAPDMAASVTAADLVSPIRGRSRSRTRRAVPPPTPPPPPAPPRPPAAAAAAAADTMSPSPSPTDTMGVLSGILTWGGYVVRKSLGGAAAAAAVASFGPDDRDDDQEAEKRAFLTGSSLAARTQAPAGVPIPAPARRRYVPPSTPVQGGGADARVRSPGWNGGATAGTAVNGYPRLPN